MKIFALIVILCPAMSIAQAGSDAYHYSLKKFARYKKVAVASAHPLASSAGVAIMKQGGNAFDAAVAVQLVLAVVYPEAGNIGGGGFLLGRKKNGILTAIDFREKAPGRASANMYLDSTGNADPAASTAGRLAVGIPGTVAGLFATLKYGRLPFSKLVRPAIQLARTGYAITEREAASLNHDRDNFARNNDHPVAFVKDRPWKAGDTLIQPELAATLTRLQKNGLTDFYEGKTAQLIVGEMKKAGGILTAGDLRSYKAKERTPLTFNYRGFRVIGFPPPSSGGILVAQMLKTAGKYPLATYGFQSPAAVHLMTEIERRAYADRAEHMGDPDYYRVPVETLISDRYLTGRMKDFDPLHAGRSATTRAGEIKERKETTHISIIDDEGNMVAVTTTLNGGFGCGIVVEGAGFFLNNEMDDFSVKPGVPNMFGATGGKANAIAPGKRMLSSMSPTLVLKNSRPYLIIGTPGGTTIPTSVFQTIVNIIDFDMSISDAVNKPKFHHQWLPDNVEVEKGFDPATKAALQKMGHQLVDVSSIGRMEVIEVKEKVIEVCGDRRGDDSVDGY